MSHLLHSSRSLGNLPLGKREDGEGLESCEKTCEEFAPFEAAESDSLLADTIAELQKALYESKRLLSERDSEINALRVELEQSRGSIDATRSYAIEDEFKKSQIKVIALEKTVQQLQQDISIHRTQAKDNLNSEQDDYGTTNGYKCYCGSICVAMQEVVDLKRKLHQTEHKYLNLKRNMRSRERNRVKVGVAHRDSPCTVS